MYLANLTESFNTKWVWGSHSTLFDLSIFICKMSVPPFIPTFWDCCRTNVVWVRVIPLLSCKHLFTNISPRSSSQLFFFPNPVQLIISNPYNLNHNWFFKKFLLKNLKFCLQFMSWDQGPTGKFLTGSEWCAYREYDMFVE